MNNNQPGSGKGKYLLFALVAFGAVFLNLIIQAYTGGDSFIAHLIVNAFIFVVALWIVVDSRESLMGASSVYFWITSVLLAANLSNQALGGVGSVWRQLGWFFIFQMVVISIFIIFKMRAMTNESFGQSMRDVLSVFLVPFISIGLFLGFLGFYLTSQYIADAMTFVQNLAGGVHFLIQFTFMFGWALWALFQAEQRGSGLATFVVFCYILLAFLVIGGSVMITFGFARPSGDVNGIYDLSAITSLGSAAIGNVFNIYNQTRTDLDQITDPTRGFEQQVERGATQGDVGVFLERPALTLPETQVGKPIAIAANVVARTSTHPFDVSAGCFIKRGNDDPHPGTVRTPTFRVSDYQYHRVECMYDATSSAALPTGNVLAHLYADYAMETSGYTRRYYVSQQRLDQITQQQQNPFDVFSVPQSERRPASISTQGPLMLTIGTLNFLQGIPDNPGEKTAVQLGIKLEQRSNHPGRLQQLHSLTFSVPTGFRVLEQPNGNLACSPGQVVPLTTDQCVNECDDVHQCVQDCSLFRSYRYTGNVTQLPITVTCDLDHDTAQIVLQNSPIAIKSYRATASYVYRSEQTLSLIMRPAVPVTQDNTTQLHPFTTLPILSQFRNQELQDFQSNSAQYVEQLNQYNWGTDQTLRYLAIGTYLHFWAIHAGEEQYCSDQVPQAGIMGLHKNIVADDSTCPVTMDGNAQIQHVLGIMSEHASACASAECIVGKYYCGSHFEWGNYNSCSQSGICSWCHQTFIPRVITYAQAAFSEVGQ